MRINQVPLQQSYFAEVTETRFQLERHFNMESDMQKLVQEISEGQEDKKGMIVNARVKSNRLFYGRTSLVSSETNEIDFKEEIYQVFIEKKTESKISVNCRSKFRKTFQKKLSKYLS